jgi:hypothetical protein
MGEDRADALHFKLGTFMPRLAPNLAFIRAERLGCGWLSIGGVAAKVNRRAA